MRTLELLRGARQSSLWPGRQRPRSNLRPVGSRSRPTRRAGDRALSLGMYAHAGAILEHRRLLLACGGGYLVPLGRSPVWSVAGVGRPTWRGVTCVLGPTRGVRGDADGLAFPSSAGAGFLSAAVAGLRGRRPREGREPRALSPAGVMRLNDADGAAAGPPRRTSPGRGRAAAAQGPLATGVGARGPAEPPRGPAGCSPLALLCPAFAGARPPPPPDLAASFGRREGLAGESSASLASKSSSD